MAASAMVWRMSQVEGPTEPGQGHEEEQPELRVVAEEADAADSVLEAAVGRLPDVLGVDPGVEESEAAEVLLAKDDLSRPMTRIQTAIRATTAAIEPWSSARARRPFCGRAGRLARPRSVGSTSVGASAASIGEPTAVLVAPERTGHAVPPRSVRRASRGALPHAGRSPEPPNGCRPSSGNPVIRRVSGAFAAAR